MLYIYYFGTMLNDDEDFQTATFQYVRVQGVNFMEPKIVKVKTLDEAIVAFKKEMDTIEAQGSVSPQASLCVEFELFDYDVRLCLYF